MNQILVDTGALVALLDRSDSWHDWAVSVFKTLPAPLLTCEAVLAETLHLLQKAGPSQKALSHLHRCGVLGVKFDFESEAPAVWRLLEKYADTPMDFADACLLRMSELQASPLVWTTDSDFRIYRRKGRLAVPLIIPD
jgi:predicted nucleic acid-binding protein